jgi:hypothetical protein
MFVMAGCFPKALLWGGFEIFLWHWKGLLEWRLTYYKIFAYSEQPEHNMEAYFHVPSVFWTQVPLFGQ